jgi:hypothetical protein
LIELDTRDSILKLSDVAEQLIIDHRKLTQYALNRDATEGHHKAILFERVLGFTLENYPALVRQLENQCMDAETIFRGENEYGSRYQVDLLIEDANGRKATVRTGWIIEPETKLARLTTLFILRR